MSNNEKLLMYSFEREIQFWVWIGTPRTKVPMEIYQIKWISISIHYLPSEGFDGYETTGQDKYNLCSCTILLYDFNAEKLSTRLYCHIRIHANIWIIFSELTQRIALNLNNFRIESQSFQMLSDVSSCFIKFRKKFRLSFNFQIHIRWDYFFPENTWAAFRMM